MNALNQFLDRFGEAPLHLRGASIFRIIVGMALLYQFTMLVGHFDLTLGTDSIFDRGDFVSAFGETHFSYLVLSSSPAWQWFGLVLAIMVIGVWTTGVGISGGIRGHILTAATWWSVHSVHARIPTLWDGGDNLIEIVLLYAIFADLWITPQSARKRGRTGISIHNLAIMMCALQICAMYFTAGLAKVPGKYWQNGTAFYYVLASREFGMTSLGPLIWDRRFLLALLTWGPLLLQLAFPWIYLFGRPWPRRIAVVLAMSFHVGIVVMMGLTTFAVIMLGAEFLLLSDADLEALRGLIQRGLRAAKRLIGRTTVRGGLAQQPDSDEITELR